MTGVVQAAKNSGINNTGRNLFTMAGACQSLPTL
jgi:hypothetical protein